MRRLWIFALLAGALAAPSLAPAQVDVDPDDEQAPPPSSALPAPPSDRAGAQAQPGEHLLQLLDKRLSLKPEQREKIKNVLGESGAQIKALHDKIEKLMRAQNEKIRAVLDDEQKPKFDEITVEMRKHMQEGPGFHPDRRRRPGPPEKEEEGARRMGPSDDPRDLPPPEMWHQGRQPPPGDVDPNAPSGDQSDRGAHPAPQAPEQKR